MGNYVAKTESQIDRLESIHRVLARKVEVLERQLYLTTSDQLRITRLKKQKLAAKDALIGLKRA